MAPPALCDPSRKSLPSCPLRWGVFPLYPHFHTMSMIYCKIVYTKYYTYNLPTRGVGVTPTAPFFATIFPITWLSVMPAIVG